jgi:4-amino-4-deoxychorismate lyase
MSQLLETIKCLNGKLFNLEFHQARIEKAQMEVFGKSEIDLSKEVKVPKLAETGLFRCRVTYFDKIDKIEFIPHNYRKIESLKIVEDKEIDYHLKYADRQKLQKLFEQRENCDDIIIVKNGYVSDSFAANIVLYNGKHWVTPDTPLLPGTQRAKLLEEGIITTKKISLNDLFTYKKVGLINALNNMEEMPVVEIKNVFK